MIQNHLTLMNFVKTLKKWLELHNYSCYTSFIICIYRCGRSLTTAIETRRLRLDLMYLYKILFGKVDIEWSSMFECVPMSIRRGHCSKRFVKRSRINIRQQVFCSRIVSVWNNPPAGSEHVRTRPPLTRFYKFCQSWKPISVDDTVVTTNT